MKECYVQGAKQKKKEKRKKNTRQLGPKEKTLRLHIVISPKTKGCLPSWLGFGTH
jgi:hypothetical protein